MMKRILTLALLTIAAVSVQAQSTLRIRGSDTLGAKLIPSLAESFKKTGGKVSFDIAAEGSSTAFTNLAAGTAEHADFFAVIDQRNPGQRELHQQGQAGLG